MQRKFDPKVFQLGFVALQTTEFARTKDHYVGTIGMTQTATGDDGAAYLSLGYNSHDIVLKPADGKALLHLGYHLKPEIELSAFAADVEKLGLAVKIKSDSQPGIARLAEVEGPGGNVFQFYSQMTAPAPGFALRGSKFCPELRSQLLPLVFGSSRHRRNRPAGRRDVIPAARRRLCGFICLTVRLYSP